MADLDKGLGAQQVDAEVLLVGRGTRPPKQHVEDGLHEASTVTGKPGAEAVSLGLHSPLPRLFSFSNRWVSWGSCMALCSDNPPPTSCGEERRG